MDNRDITEVATTSLSALWNQETERQTGHGEGRPIGDNQLALLAEQAEKLVQAINKVRSHGYDAINSDRPDDGDYREQLCRELGNVSHTIEVMRLSGNVDSDRVNSYATVAAYRQAD